MTLLFLSYWGLFFFPFSLFSVFKMPHMDFNCKVCYCFWSNLICEGMHLVAAGFGGVK